VEARSVSHTLFDHTSIIKTILTRFCPAALDKPQRPNASRGPLNIRPRYLGERVAQANHLGALLSATAPRPALPRDALIRAATARAATRGAGGDPETKRTAQATFQLTDLQKRILAATNELTRLGLPAVVP
jgi:phospholipase C